MKKSGVISLMLSVLFVILCSVCMSLKSKIQKSFQSNVFYHQFVSYHQFMQKTSQFALIDVDHHVIEKSE